MEDDLSPSSDKSQSESQRSSENQFIYVFLRYSVSLVVLVYAFAKINGAQFTILDSELDKPMGQVSGFWLTWYYFGYSKIYGNIIALAQIAGAILLTFRKTTLLAVCLLIPILANILLVDLFYAISLGALIVALFLLVGLLILLTMHRVELIDLFWHCQNRLFPTRSVSRALAAGKWAARASFILFAAAYTYYVANFNNRNPTPLDGAWDVVRIVPVATTQHVPSVIFFERNRAELCVFKSAEGSYQWHDFEVDKRTHSIGIWREWLSKGPAIFTGHYELSSSELSFEGKFTDNPEQFTLSLRKRN